MQLLSKQKFLFRFKLKFKKINLVIKPETQLLS